jgi:Trk-type K+ transport system membrane component
VVGYFDRLYDVTCVLFVPEVYRATILIITISVAMFIGGCASACAGIRFYKVSEVFGTTNAFDKKADQPYIDDETQALK